MGGEAVGKGWGCVGRDKEMPVVDRDKEMPVDDDGYLTDGFMM